MRFVNIVKPTHICNLACTYCYNDDVRDPVMRDETLRRTIDQTFAYVASHSVFDDADFIWHGGEPMVPGLKFFEKVVTIQQECSRGVKYANSIQTNGTLITDKWIEFFKQNKFAVSVSIDGSKEIHDTYRLTKSGKGSYDSVFRAITKLRGSGLNFGVCMVLSKATIGRAREILQFFASEGLPFNVIPMTRSGGARDSYDELGLSSSDYADAWIEMYDEWLALGKSHVYVQDFALKTRAIIYGQASDCIGMANCSHFNISIDPIGDVYPCASLSGNPGALYGNINSDSLPNILAGGVAAEFKNREIDEHCKSCDWQHVCHGGCVSRSYKFYGNIHQRDYYCPSLYRIYEHIALRLREQGVSPGARSPSHMTDGVEPDTYKKFEVPISPKGMRKIIPINLS